ncbi:Proteasome activator complex subunit 4 [Smittium mucronatum]|uniref:Proteasome activator complex subunit 4 n=1 Tax=Smittium mucronatum TaxID=133383 RepID=A0A1R0GN81_9FUNG|nr:Proteasome activator complex subunit 4 [Smittium mucronatum]
MISEMNLISKIRLARPIVACFSWRIIPIIIPFISSILNLYNSANKILRDAVGSVICSAIYSAEYRGFIIKDNSDISLSFESIISSEIDSNLDLNFETLTFSSSLSILSQQISNFIIRDPASFCPSESGVITDSEENSKTKLEGNFDDDQHPINCILDYLGSENDFTRISASNMLKNMVSYLSNSLLNRIIKRFVSTVESISLSSKKNKALNSNSHHSPSGLNDEYVDKLKIKHSSVIGLSCLILAFPYSIPEWMPQVLLALISCISDPSPINTAVTKTFAEFKKTHLDTWHIDRKMFSCSQLEILSDVLVSPGYYI